MSINVLMAVDKNFISQARVTIWSARKHTDKKTKLIFTILCSKELDDVSRNRLLALMNEWEKLIINIYEINECDFSKVRGVKYFPAVASYRLVAAKVLDADKCIYLDSDLIVSLDLKDLYEIDISDYYIGGVVDMGLILNPNLAYDHSRKYNIINYSDYINSGVLLMNLELMRKEHLVEKFLLELIQSQTPWPDQDVINRICHGKIYLTDWTFNHIVNFSDKEYFWQCGRSKREGQGEIYHWAGTNKPWYNYSVRKAKLWWEIAKEALEPQVFQECYCIADNCMRQAFFFEIAKRCKEKDEEIIIVGFSDHGMKVMHYLRKCGINGKIIFCDNNKLKREMCLMGSRVVPIEEAASNYKNAIWINAIQNARDEVSNQIKLLGIPNNQILEYHAMCSDDYLLLEEEYMIRGLKEKVYLQR